MQNCVRILCPVSRLAGLLLFCAATSSPAATWYVDNSATGANNGTSWANAWNAISRISGVGAGDTVYISGGSVSQTYGVNSWSPAGGSAGNPVTYQTGQDAGHNGTVIFDVQQNANWLLSVNNAVISGQVNGATNMIVTNAANVVVNGNNSQNLKLAYIVFPNMVGGFRLNYTTGIEFDHCLIYKVPDPAGILNSMDYVVQGPGGTGFDQNKFHDCMIWIPASSTNSAWGDDGIDWMGGTSIYSNHFKVYYTNYPGAQHSDVMQTQGSYLKIYNNFFENIGESILYHDSFSAPIAAQSVWFYNNVCYQSTAPHSAVARGLDLQPELSGVGTTFTDFIVANNTFVDFTAIWAVRIQNALTYSNCYVVNNIFYNCVQPMANMSPLPAGITVFYNKAIAGTQGTSVLSPPDSSGPGGTGTIQFVNYAQYSPNNDLHLATNDTGATGAGTSFPYTYFTTDKDGVARPQSSAWDLGAYVNTFGMSTNTNLQPAVSAITQNLPDADPNLPGIQVFTGSMVLYSATATDPNHLPITWQWIYTTNGGPEVVYQTGAGAVTPASFVYSTLTAGNTFVWKLRVSDGQATSESDFMVDVEMPPYAGQVFAAPSGAITAPFVVMGNYISQPTSTGVTNGGSATYNFTVTNAGNYVIQGVVNAPDLSANSFYVNIDAQPQDPANVWQIPVTSGFEPRVLNWQGNGTFDAPQFVPQVFTLTAGAHQLIIRGREASTQIQSFSILNVPSAPQSLHITPSP